MSISTNTFVSPCQVEDNLLYLKNLCFEVTDACNLACDYCVYRDLYGDHDARVGKKMNFGYVKSVIDYLSNIWRSGSTGRIKDCVTISFYGGEPLLNIHLIKETVAYLKKVSTNRTFAYNMTTNATMLDKYIDYFVENDFDILVSLDGDVKANGHRRTHSGHSSFYLVFDNLRKIKKDYPEYFERKIRFNAVLTDLNDIETTLDFINREFGVNVNFSEINPRGLKSSKVKEFEGMRNRVTDSVAHASDMSFVQEMMGLKFPELDSFIQFVRRKSGNYYGGYLSLLSNSDKHKFRPVPGTCTPFAKKMFITVNGRILQCERIGQDFSLGSVCEDGVHLIPEEVAEAFNKRIEKMLPVCYSCCSKTSCKKCFYYLKDIHGDNPICLSYNKHSNQSTIEYREFLAKNPMIMDQIAKQLIIQ